MPSPAGMAETACRGTASRSGISPIRQSRSAMPSDTAPPTWWTPQIVNYRYATARIARLRVLPLAHSDLNQPTAFSWYRRTVARWSQSLGGPTYAKIAIALSILMLLTGCGDDTGDAGTEVTVATTNVVGGVVPGDDWAVPEPFGPVTCQCPELAAYVTGLAQIGHLFADGEVTFRGGQLRVTGALAGSDPQYPELIEILGETIPGVNRLSESQVGVFPEWRLLLNPDAGSRFDAWILLDDIMAVGDLEQIADPDTHDPEGVAAIQAEAIEALADLEAALNSIEQDSTPSSLQSDSGRAIEPRDH